MRAPELEGHSVAALFECSAMKDTSVFEDGVHRSLRMGDRVGFQGNRFVDTVVPDKVETSAFASLAMVGNRILADFDLAESFDLCGAALESPTLRIAIDLLQEAATASERDVARAVSSSLHFFEDLTCHGAIDPVALDDAVVGRQDLVAFAVERHADFAFEDLQALHNYLRRISAIRTDNEGTAAFANERVETFPAPAIFDSVVDVVAVAHAGRHLGESFRMVRIVQVLPYHVIVGVELSLSAPHGYGAVFGCRYAESSHGAVVVSIRETDSFDRIAAHEAKQVGGATKTALFQGSDSARSEIVQLERDLLLGIVRCLLQELHNRAAACAAGHGDGARVPEANELSFDVVDDPGKFRISAFDCHQSIARRNDGSFLDCPDSYGKLALVRFDNAHPASHVERFAVSAGEGCCFVHHLLGDAHR